jgi:hypothetical protein
MIGCSDKIVNAERIGGLHGDERAVIIMPAMLNASFSFEQFLHNGIGGCGELRDTDPYL